MNKVDVNGANSHVVFRYLKTACGDESDISWNFGKFLVNRNATGVRRYNPKESPLSFLPAIEGYLAGNSDVTAEGAKVGTEAGAPALNAKPTAAAASNAEAAAAPDSC